MDRSGVRRWDSVGSCEGYVQVILTLVIVLLAAAIGYGIFLLKTQESRVAALSSQASSIEQRLKAAESLAQKLSLEHKKDSINLTIPGVQRINDDFLVAKLSVDQFQTGVKVKGIIINATALEQNDAKFRITIGSQLTEFTVKKISPGSSRRFEADILATPIEKAVSADVQFISSAVSYYVD